MKLIIAIGVGSFIGGIARYLLSKYIISNSNDTFPFGTLIVNIIGCFIIGIIFGLFEKGQVTETWKLILATGIIGGFTTFSAFSIETINLYRNGQTVYATTYIFASVVIGLVATLLALSITKAFA